MDISATVATAERAASSGEGPLRVLGRANSFNVRKVLWVCDEIGIPYTREDFGRGFKPTNTPEFLKLNLTGQVPVVIDGDLDEMIKTLQAADIAEQLKESSVA